MTRPTSSRFVAAALLGWLLLIAAPAAAAYPQAVRGSGGTVASAAPAATDAGLEVLAAGGNAVDAAVATALALAVVHPQAGNLGGGGFAVVKIGDEVASLDFRETAPAMARPKMFLGRDGEPVPEKSLVGPLAAGVPGSPAGLAELHQRFGRLPWARVVEPAIRLAQDGFVVTRRLAEEIDEDRELLARFPDTAQVWLPEGQAPRPGSRMVLADLADTLSLYAERGPEAISSGRIAAAIEAASRQHGGILRVADLAAYRPVWREPVRFEAAGWRVASMSLPSSGGIILGQTIGILERVGWAERPRFGADRAHLLVEALRRAYADRMLLGDPRTTRAKAADLLAAVWLDRRARSIDRRERTPSSEVRPWPGEAPIESSETTHLSVIDADGGAVSLTTTLNGRFGCGLLVRGAGFLLNNEMDDFAAAPGRPNLYGLVQGEANAVGAGKRMLSSMSPTILWRGSELIALGSPGGSRIPTATLQVMTNLIVDGDELQAAVDRPRLHHQWLPDRVEYEPDALAPETRAELLRRGHALQERQAVGEVHAVRRLASGELEAAADPRGPGSAGVVRRVE